MYFKTPALSRLQNSRHICFCLFLSEEVGRDAVGRAFLFFDYIKHMNLTGFPPDLYFSKHYFFVCSLLLFSTFTFLLPPSFPTLTYFIIYMTPFQTFSDFSSVVHLYSESEITCFGSWSIDTKFNNVVEHCRLPQIALICCYYFSVRWGMVTI